MRIYTNTNVDRGALFDLFAETEVAVLQSQTVQRNEFRNGLLCAKDEELCWLSCGLNNEQVAKLKASDLINEVEESPKVSLA